MSILIIFHVIAHSFACLTQPFKPFLFFRSVSFTGLILALLSSPVLADIKETQILKPSQSSTDTINNTFPTCVYISSYAPGYPWQDGIERGLRSTLENHCRIKTFYMNSKKVFSTSKLNKIGLHAVDFIAQNQPDLVIVSDDNATRHVLAKHYKDSSIPFVFCGMNNTASGYQLLYSNTTGMIEKTQTEYLLKLLFNIEPAKTRVAFLTTKGTSADKDTLEFSQLASKLGIEYQTFQVQDEKEWRKVYKSIQESPDIDLIYFSNRAAFKSWYHKKNLDWALQHNHKISFTTQDWMMPYVAIGINKVPEEQGIWTAKAAIEILNGEHPSQIAIVPNQNFQLWVNNKFAKPFASKMPESIAERSLIEKHLRKAISFDEFTLVYQPQIEIQTGLIIGVEALIRSNNPVLGFVPPDKFIPIAEDSNLILSIGEWGTKACIAQLEAWKNTEFSGLHIAMNVSSVQFESPYFLGYVRKLMELSDIPNHLLEIELTERTVMNNVTENINRFNNIRSSGFGLSVDDFGTGYSSLSYLKKFPLSILKIDKSFIDGIPQDEEDIIITTAILNLAHSLSMKVVAEGVETEEQLKFLQNLKCNIAQGYYISRPLSTADFEAWLTENKSNFFYNLPQFTIENQDA